jgi:hypothetical protein
MPSKYAGKYLLLNHVCDPPPLTLVRHKISHSLPIPCHLLLSGILSFGAILLAIISHLIDGGVKESWDLKTTIIHSAMKSGMESSSPQGRHSTDIIRHK